MTNSQRYHSGNQVGWTEGKQAFHGEVVTYRQVGDRQVLNVRLTDGRLVTVALGDDSVPALNSPVSKSEALKLAKAVVAGQEPRIPIATQINMLALALLQEAEPTS